MKMNSSLDEFGPVKKTLLIMMIVFDGFWCVLTLDRDASSDARYLQDVCRQRDSLMVWTSRFIHPLPLN